MDALKRYKKDVALLHKRYERGVALINKQNELIRSIDRLQSNINLYDILLETRASEFISQWNATYRRPA